MGIFFEVHTHTWSLLGPECSFVTVPVTGHIAHGWHQISAKGLLSRLCLASSSTVKGSLYAITVTHYNLQGLQKAYRQRANFRGHNNSWVKFTWELIFVGKSSPP